MFLLLVLLNCEFFVGYSDLSHLVFAWTYQSPFLILCLPASSVVKVSFCSPLPLHLGLQGQVIAGIQLEAAASD